MEGGAPGITSLSVEVFIPEIDVHILNSHNQIKEC